jgi:hypothetical protein
MSLSQKEYTLNTHLNLPRTFKAMSLVLSVLAASVATGAQVDCPSGDCRPDSLASQVVLAESPSVRVRISGSCGSGFIAGADSDAAYVITNAHVVGTSIGREVTIDVVSSGQSRSVRGRVVLAMYHSQRLIDAAIVRVEGLRAQRYMPMLKEPPTGQPFATRGAPRCVWPLVTKPFDRVIVSPNSPLIRGLPDAIPGQSGSGIFNSDGNAIALLAWSWGGYCAGQQTHWLWRIATERSLADVPLRPAGLEEVSDCAEPAVFVRPATEDGIFTEHDDSSQPPMQERVERLTENGSTSVRPITEDGIFNLVDSRLAQLPIWVVPGGPGPQPEPDPGPDCPPCPDCPEVCPPDYMKVTDNERALIEFIRSQQSETSRFGEFLRGIDWVALTKQIIEIIKLFQSLQ